VVQAGGSNKRRTLVDADRRRLVQLAYRFVWNKADAEDAVHNAWVIATQKGDQVRDQTKWWPWMARIVVRQCLLGHRRDGTRLRREAVFAQRRDARPAEHDDSAATAERASVIRRAIDQLSPQQRAAVTLRHLEGMAYSEVAAILGTSEATARTHVRNGREAMRTSITKAHPEVSPSQARSDKGRQP